MYVNKHLHIHTIMLCNDHEQLPSPFYILYFSTNVMFHTLHSNSTIYHSTWLPSGDVRVNTVVSRSLTVGVGRVTGGWSIM